MGCPSLLGTITGVPRHLAFDAVNGYVYIYSQTFSEIRRYDYPAINNMATIVSSSQVSGLTCDDAGNLYYILNASPTTVYKRTPGGTTTTVSTAFGSDGAFGVTWNPLDGLLYVGIQRFATGLSAVSTVDTSSGAVAFYDTETSTPPFISPDGAPQVTPDGGVWFFGGNIVYRVDSGGTRTTSGSADFNLAGNETVVPLIVSTAVVNHSSTDVAFGPTTAASSSAYACGVAADIVGAAHSDDWTTVLFLGINTGVYEILEPLPAGRKWWVGVCGWGG